MCLQNSVHSLARQEHSLIRQNGNVTQKLVTEAAWIDAREACRLKSASALSQGSPHPKGKLYFSERVIRPLLGRKVRGKVVVGEYQESHRNSPCFDILACDATGRPWMIGRLDPEVRGALRLP